MSADVVTVTNEEGRTRYRAACPVCGPSSVAPFAQHWRGLARKRRADAMLDAVRHNRMRHGA